MVQVGEPGAGGLGPFLGATTAADGRYVLQGYTGQHALVSASKAAYAPDLAEDVVIDEDGGELDFTLLRDFSSAAGGAAVEGFTGQDNTAVGCGPGGLIDDAGTTVWSTDRGAAPRAVVVDLGATVDVASIRVDPAAGCGDDDSAALGSAEILVAGAPGAPFAPLSSPTFNPGDLGRLEPVFSGVRTGVRYVKLVAEAPQGGAGAGADFIDVAELQVLKQPGTPVGPAPETGGAVAIGPAGATLTGTVAPGGGAAPDVVFEYGTTAAYGSLVAASGSPGVQAAVAGLQPSTTYHYRVVALRDGRRYEGGDATFTTSPRRDAPAGPGGRVGPIAGKKVTASRKGVFKVKVRFDPGAPEGTARLKAKRRGKVVARGTTAVVPGETRRARMELTKAGRKAIRPGRRGGEARPAPARRRRTVRKTPHARAQSADAQPSSERPVICSGCSIPSSASAVGATSARMPSPSSASAPAVTTNGTGLSECAVSGEPSSSSISSALPWSAVTMQAPPLPCTASTTRPRHSSTVSTALTAASITPVCPTMSALAKLMIANAKSCSRQCARKASVASRALISGLWS